MINLDIQPPSPKKRFEAFRDKNNLKIETTPAGYDFLPPKLFTTPANATPYFRSTSFEWSNRQPGRKQPDIATPVDSKTTSTDESLTLRKVEQVSYDIATPVDSKTTLTNESLTLRKVEQVSYDIATPQ